MDAMMMTQGEKLEDETADWRSGRKATVTKYTDATFVSKTSFQPWKSSLFQRVSRSL